MSLTDTITRIEFICKKYEGYVKAATEEEAPRSQNDSFATLYAAIDAEIDNIIQRTAEVSLERNRATVAAINAEIRRARDIIAKELGRLEKLSQKKVKGVTEADLQSRPEKVQQLWEKLNSLQDPVFSRTKKSSIQPYDKGMGLELVEAGQASDYFKSTEETRGFRDEYKKRAQFQDAQLDYISAGLERLKNIAEDMAQELENQEPVLGQMETKMHETATKLKNNNRRLNELILEVRSTTKFCIDIILISVLLGIGCYLYEVLRK